MSRIVIDPKCFDLMGDFQLPETLGFAKHFCPIMVEADYKDGAWKDFNIVPYHSLTVDPSCKVLHYGQEIFEGLKAYHVDEAGPYLFRPDQNAKRFNRSATRMAMPTIDEEVFVEAVTNLVSLCRNAIPTKSGESLYVRPYMFAFENNLGIDISNSYKFLIIASPCGSYFSDSGIRVLIEREQHRAVSGGTGWAKTGGNYAASLMATKKAKSLGCNQVLWLNALDKTTIEEMSGMNFFALIGEKLHTPKLNDTVLDGITRNSVIKLAEHLKFPVVEDKISIDDLLEAIEQGECTECFATGTAAIITPIIQFVKAPGEFVTLKEAYGPITRTIRTCMLDIQEGRTEDLFGWRYEVPQALTIDSFSLPESIVTH